MEQVFCPLIRTVCHGEGCILWKSEACLLSSFVELVSTPRAGKAEELDVEERISSEIEVTTPEQLAVELVAFARGQFPEDKDMTARLYRVKNVFWASKGLAETLSLPSEIRLKVEKAEMLAERKLEEDHITREKMQVEKERQLLPSLVNECVGWARSLDLRRVTKSDISAFLAERNIELSTFSAGLLYAKANLSLKQR